MRMARSIRRLLLLVALAWIANAQAQVCTVASSTGLNFGTNLGSSPTAQVDVSGSITLTCVGGGNGQPRRACLALSTTAPVPTPRQMVSGANTLNFQVYDNAVGGPIIATATSESAGMIMERTFTSGSPSNTPVNVTFPIAGRLLSGQTVGSGDYSLSMAIYSDAGNFGPGACAPGTMISAGGAFPVSAGVGGSCTLDVPDVSFGTVKNLTTTRNTSTNAAVTCTTGAAWTLALNAGSTPGNTYAQRYMSVGGTGPAAVLYQIYRDAGPANIWGNGTGGTVTRSGTGTGVAQSIPIYLQVPAQLPRAEGTYRDTVTATLTF